MFEARKIAVLVTCCATAFAGLVARAQTEAESAMSQPPLVADETVFVRGFSPGNLRRLVEEAEEAVYARFNEINSDDQFDIYCYIRQEIGSRVLRRRCLPNYWREADTEVGEETVRGMQSGGGPAFNPQAIASEAHYKGLLLTEEMQRLTAEDEELLAATVRLVNLQQSLGNSEGLKEAADATLERQVSPDQDAVAVDYQADAVFEVRMGNRSWRHELSTRTFTIARVNGEIRDLKVECDENEIQLEQEIGVDWTLPAGWGACTVVVDAMRDTTFALYEFR